MRCKGSLTKLILEIYDEMAEAMMTSKTYQTCLGSPPGPPDSGARIMQSY